MSNLVRTGVQTVIDGLPNFLKGMDSFNAKINQATKVAQNAAKNITPANKALGGLNDKLKDLVQQSGPTGNALSGILNQIGGIPPAALLAVGAVAAIVAALVGLGAAFFALGNRGAALVPLAESFDRLTASVGISSQALLIDLRKAANGTVSDFDLIRRANLALVGSTGEFGKQFGKQLPQVLAAARAAAKATGQDVDFLFQSLVSGIKRSSPMLIDNTGIVLKLGAANEELAAKLGKSVTELTSEEKQIATLNATVTAGAALITSLGDAQESNTEKIARANATITNIFDSLAISLQPVFGTILDAVQRILNVFAGFVPYLAVVFQFVGKIIAGIVGHLADIIPPDLPKRLFEGAAAAFGSFANGIIKVANKLIFPAVIAIAKFIADFLIGFSPPKEGPLSQIDKGGQNLMLAWLDGIAGVSLDPVKKVAQQVSDALGVIGKQSLVKVDARLAQMDKALLPFQNRLDIIKAQFEALNAPAKSALDAIDRQAALLQDAVAAGNPEAVEKLRILDSQREAIQKQLDLEQGLVDRAQIQLGLKQAQQAPERALLNIRKAYLEALAKGQVTTTSTGEYKAPKEKKGPKGAESPVTPTGGIVPPHMGSFGLPEVLDLIGDQSAIDKAAAGIQTAFMGEIDEKELEKSVQNYLDLGGQIDRIKSVDLGSKITDKFKGLTDAFNPAIAGSVANVVTQFFNGDSSNPNSLAGIFSRAGESLESVKDSVGEQLKTTLASIFDPDLEGSAMNSILILVGNAVGNDNLPGEVANFFAGLPERIITGIGDLTTKLKTDIFDPLFSFLTGGDPGSLGDILNQVVGFFTGLPTRIVDALRGIGAAVYSALAVPVIQAINGLIGLIETGIQGLVTKIADFVGSIANALGEAAPQFLKDTINQLHAAAGNVKFGRISTELPAFLQSAPLAGATGGIFGKGFMTVGEKGTELVYNASKMGVVPHELTSILTSLQSILAQPQPMAIPAGNTSNTNNSSFTFNGVAGDNDARRRYNTLRAGMR